MSLLDQIIKVPIYNDDGTLKSEEQLNEEYDQLKQNYNLATDIAEQLEPEFNILQQELEQWGQEGQAQDEDGDTQMQDQTQPDDLDQEEAAADDTEMIQVQQQQEDEEDPNNEVTHNGVKKRKHINVQKFIRGSDNIYLNVEIQGDETLKASQPEYNIIRDDSFIKKASDYYLSIVRFNIPAYYAPIGYFLTQPNDLVTGLYAVTFQVDYDDEKADPPQGTITETAYLKFENPGPSSLNQYFRGLPLQTDQGNYIYYLFTYSVFTNMVNVALKSAWDAMVGNAYFPYKDNNVNLDGHPFVVYDPATKLFTFWADELCILNAPDGTPLATNPVKIYFNEYLYEFFNSFPAIQINPNNTITNEPIDYQLNILSTITNETQFEIYDTTFWFSIIQDYVTIINWNPFRKILIVTNLLPVQTELVDGSGDGFLPIISDFIPTIDTVDVRSTFQYTPAGQYRLVDLISDGPINKVDIFVYWQDLWGNLNTLYLEPWATMSVKLGFFNKELYNNNALYGYENQQ